MLPQPLTSARTLWRIRQRLAGEGGELAVRITRRANPTRRSTFPIFPPIRSRSPIFRANVVAQAAALVTAAGITDPVTAAAAELDYIATGDPSFIASAANVNQQVTDTVAPTITPSTTPTAAIGVAATATKVTEAASGVDGGHVHRLSHRCERDRHDSRRPRSITRPTLGGGAALPSGSVVIAANQTTAQITIDVPQGALGDLAGREPAGSGQFAGRSPFRSSPRPLRPRSSTIKPRRATSAVPELAYLGNIGTFSFDAATNTYTLNLGGVTQGASDRRRGIRGRQCRDRCLRQSLGDFHARRPATGFIVTGDNLPTPLGAGRGLSGPLRFDEHGRSRRQRACR